MFALTETVLVIINDVVLLKENELEALILHSRALWFESPLL